MYLILFFLSLSCGGFVGAAFLDKRFEEMLPLSCSVIALTVFVFGLIGLLPFGPVAILAATAAAYLLGCLHIRKTKNFAAFCRSFFTPGFVCFFMLYFILWFLDRGLLMSGSDDFGHWGLVVKEMLRLGSFSTSSLSFDRFGSYPPIMACFQYFLQRLSSSFRQVEVTEWLMYFAHQLFSLAFLIPVMRYTSWKRPVSAFFGFGVICLAPMVVFPYLYNTILIDSFLGIVFSYGFVMFLTNREKSRTDYLSAFLSLSVLVLAKESGMQFAVISCIAFAFAEYRSSHSLKENWKPLLAALLFLLVPKLLWSLHLAMHHVTAAHSSNGGLMDLLRLVTLRDDSGYRYQSVALFFRLLYGTAYHFTLVNHSIPYMYVLIGILLLAYLLRPFLKRCGVLSESAAKLICPLLVLHILVYSVGLIYVYLFRMPAYEALGMDAMDRYFDTVVLSVWMVLIILVMQAFFEAEGERKSFLTFLLAASLLIIIPRDSLVSFLTRQNVRAAQSVRERYSCVVDAAEECLENESDRIFIVAQHPKDEILRDDQRILTYLLVPNPCDAYTLGISDWEGDRMYGISCSDWLKSLKENYQFVILYHLDDYFLENYSQAFVSPEDIQPFSIYRVDPQTGLLTLVTHTEYSYDS